MSDSTSDHSEGSSPPGPVIRDRRRLDPETGQLRDAYGATEPPTPAEPPLESPNQPRHSAQSPAPQSPSSESGQAAQSASDAPSSAQSEEPVIEPVGPDGRVGSDGPVGSNGSNGSGSAEDVSLDAILADLDAAQSSAAERLVDLQRLQAEFVNYRRRVDRDRDVARDTAVAGFLEALLPVLDDVHLARQHGDLEGGPFAAITEKLEGVLQRFGLSRYGEQGEEFDPAVHEALMHTEAELPEGTKTTTVVQVLQPGYRTGDRVLRAARVAVADPQ
jgi:molecular chaperone GrpE